MYTIHADGQLLFSTASEAVESIVLSPQLTLDVENAGSLSFTIPPGNSLHGKIKKMKTIVTVEQDGVQIFRGRATETETDYYNQQNVYCEGERAFLLDSVHEPYEYSGSVQGLFSKLIANHNSLVESEKQFTVGTITAVSSGETLESESDSYVNTSEELESKLLDAYGGYLKTRTVGDVHYIDWLKKYGSTSGQTITFSVNLLNLKDKIETGDVFTVLIPQGYSEIGDDGEYTDPVNISSVNGGQKYIQDDNGVALYGKIWRVQTWPNEESPQKLLAKAREYLKTGAALQTVTLKAIDMHFLDGDVEKLQIGDDVRILSNPHGVDQTILCAKMEIDLLNPENTSYTFGEAPKALTDNTKRVEKDVNTLTGRGGGGGRSVKETTDGITRWATIFKDEQNGRITLNAGELVKVTDELDNTKERLSEAEILIDGANAQITLAASRMDDIEGSVTSAEIDIDGLNAEIELKVSKDGVISSINQTSESITISASKINLSGYVTASNLSAEIASINTAINNAVSTKVLSAVSANLGSASVGGYDLIMKSKSVVTGGTVNTTAKYNTWATSDGTWSGSLLTGVTLNLTKTTISYWGYS